MTRRLVGTVVALGVAGLITAVACMSSSGSGNLTILATTSADGGGTVPDGGGTIPDGGGTIPDGGGTIPDGGGTVPDGGSDGGIGGLDLGHGIILTEVRLLLRRVVLEQCGAPTCTACAECSQGRGESNERCDDCDECEEGERDVRAGPVLVDLKGSQLAGGVQAVLDANVRVGDYSAVKIVISQASQRMVKEHPELAAMQALHASIAIDGTIDGAAFEFVTPMQVRQARCGPFRIGTDTSALTLVVDASGWFVGDRGQRLDPRAASDRGEILENLRKSIRAKARGDGGDDDDCACPPADGGSGGGSDGGL